jgi:hypothetical protein
MHGLALRDDHVLERKLKQGAQRRQRSLLSSSPFGAVSVRYVTMNKEDVQRRMSAF